MEQSICFEDEEEEEEEVQILPTEELFINVDTYEDTECPTAATDMTGATDATSASKYC